MVDLQIDGIICHQMSSDVIPEIGKNVETAGKRMKGSRKSISKSIAKPSDYADRRELKSLSYLGS